MKTLIAASVLCISAIVTNAQGPGINTRVSTDNPSVVTSNELNTNEAKEIITDIMNVVGLKPGFEVYIANVSNAAAVVTNGKRYIFYNPAFIQKLNIAGGNRWAAVSVLAHEIGHHLNGHTLKNIGSQPSLELEADEFSGFIMRKMGATLEQAQAAMKIAADYKPSLTHPGQQSRTSSIETGWNKAGAVAVNADVAKYNAPVTVSTDNASTTAATQTEIAVANREARNAVAATVIDESNILGDVYFPSDKDGNYFLTTRHNLVKISNGKLYMAGKLIPTDSPVYPFAISSGKDNSTQFLVDKSGKILTLKGNAAGFIRARD